MTLNRIILYVLILDLHSMMMVTNHPKNSRRKTKRIILLINKLFKPMFLQTLNICIDDSTVPLKAGVPSKFITLKTGQNRFTTKDIS